MRILLSDEGFLADWLLVQGYLVLEYLSLLDKANVESVFYSPDPAGLQDIEAGGQLALFAYLTVLLVVLAHGDVSHCLPLPLRQLAQEQRLINEGLVLVQSAAYHFLHCSLEGLPVDVPQEASCLCPNRSRTGRVEEEG